MRVRRDVGEIADINRRCLAVRADDERCSRDPHHFLAVHVLLFQNIVGDGHFPLRVGQQSEGQAFLIGKLSLGSGSIWGYAKQHGARLLNLFI